MNTQKETPTDAEEEFTGTSVPLCDLLCWDAEDLQKDLRRAADKAQRLYLQASCIEMFLKQVPEIDKLQEIFDKVRHLLDEEQKEEFTRLLRVLRKLEDL